MRPDEVVQGFVQFDLENLQGWSMQDFLLPHAPLLDSPHSSKNFTFINFDPSCFELCTISCPVTYCCEKLGSIFSTLFAGIARLPLGPPVSSLLQAKRASVLSLSSSHLRV